MNRDELLASIAQALGVKTQAVAGVAPRPKELDDLRLDPKLRAAVLEGHTGTIMDRSQNTWSEQDRKDVNEQIQSVLRGMGYNG